MIRLQREPIDYAAITESVRTPTCGAVVLFLGTVRELTGSRRTTALAYEGYEGMAASTMQAIAEETKARWPVGAIAIVHRLGHLQLGEISVAIAVSCPHRAQAFEACKYAMDRVKEAVPVWKQEHWADGTTEWVHPGLDALHS